MKTPSVAPHVSSDAEEVATAIMSDDVHHLRAMITRGLSPDTIVWRWDRALLLALRLRRVRCARLLLRAGASPHPSHTGRAPLVAAVAKNLSALVRALLERGADPNLADPHEELTALELAVVSNRPRLVALLCQAGADTDARIARFPSLGYWPHKLPSSWTETEFLHRARHRRQLLARPEWCSCDLRRTPLTRTTPLVLVALSVNAPRCADILFAHGADRFSRDSANCGWDDYIRHYGQRERRRPG